jgi:hypothetical protein
VGLEVGLFAGPDGGEGGRGVGGGQNGGFLRRAATNINKVEGLELLDIDADRAVGDGAGHGTAAVAQVEMYGGVVAQKRLAGRTVRQCNRQGDAIFAPQPLL